ncbi:MAG: NAD-dependent epimerase/dehydratase family protein [Acetobacteraceae bacterium]
MRRVALIGAGFIARVHADALRSLPGVGVTAVIDPNLEAARRLAGTVGAAAQVFASADAAIAADAFDCAHVLVPPSVHHAAALPLLRAGRPVLLEKPLAATGAECAALLEAAGQSGAPIGVNQNFLHHPAFVRLRDLVAARSLGKPNFVGCIYNVSLRQFSARQFGHWMFAAPVNLLLEQAVHPLSQIAALAGAIGEVAVRAGPSVEIAPGLPFHATLDASLACDRLPAQLRFAVGQSFPFWQVTVVCDDGVIVADILANRTFAYRRTRWLEAIDGLASGARTAAAIFGASCRNVAAYAASTFKLAGRNDPFFLSMRGSIAAFHAALDAGSPPPIDGRFGAMLVSACERIGSAAFRPLPLPSPPPRAATAVAACDVAVLGGTGFIGTHVVRQLVEGGARVAVMARSVRHLPAIFTHPSVSLQPGDLRDRDAVAAAIGTAPVVVNLAHGGGGASWEEVRDAMVGGAAIVADACAGRRLIHIGSIAALYLGPQPSPITGATPTDPQAEERADYARAKAMTDRMLLERHARDGLRLCILRPGLVVGEGGVPFHSGLGFFNNDQHCIGWNAGRNPLPFVLVEDVAAAILLAVATDAVDGHCYNLVGDVRPSARDYIAQLAEAMQRPLTFRPQSVDLLWLVELGKYLIKRATGRRGAPPSRRDLLSRGLRATFDCGDAKRDLGWSPVADPARFHERAILVHGG